MNPPNWIKDVIGPAELRGMAIIVAAVLCALLFAANRTHDVVERGQQKGQPVAEGPGQDDVFQDTDLHPELGKETQVLMGMLQSAPQQGDFEISFPSLISEQDMVLQRVEGLTRVKWASLDPASCLDLARFSQQEGFTSTTIVAPHFRVELSSKAVLAEQFCQHGPFDVTLSKD